MSLYFDIRIKNPENASVNTLASWHLNLPLLAVATYCQEKGGFVAVYDDQGELQQDIELTGYYGSQITVLNWHPSKKWLTAGWDNGKIKIWLSDIGNREFNELQASHKHNITILQWSLLGTRLISADSDGIIVCWKIDVSGIPIMVYHYELRDSLTHITLSNIKKQNVNINHKGINLMGNSDRSLDVFSNWRPRTAIQSAMSSKDKDICSFFIGSKSGKIYYIDNDGKLSKVYNTENSSLSCLLYHQVKDSLVVMTEGLNIIYFDVNPLTGNLNELTRVKLNTKGDISKTNSSLLCWISDNTLAILTGELSVRCWNSHTGDTYVLNPPSNSMNSPQEIFTSISYCKINRTLAVGTNLGSIYFWKRSSSNANVNEYGWPIVPKCCTVHGTIKQLTWGGNLFRNPLLAVNSITNVFILHQQNMCAANFNNISAVQLSPTQLFIKVDSKTNILKTDLQIQLLSINNHYIAVSSSRQIAIYKININDSNKTITTTFQQSFPCDAEKLIIYESTLIILTAIAIQLRSIEGIFIQTLPILPEEGEPITMELNKHYLTVASLNGTLKIWDISKREVKLHTRPIPVYEFIKDFAEVIEAKCNCDCSYISITVAMSNLCPSSTLYIWDVERDEIFDYDFSEANQNNLAIGRLITSHCWDQTDPRVLICRAEKIKKDKDKLVNNENDVPLISNDTNSSSNNNSDVILISMFITPDHGILIQNFHSLVDTNCRLLDVQSPFIIILNPEKENDENKITQLLMKEFEDIGPCDSTTKKAILDFSFYISIANMDEAFKAIKAIKNETVWKSLAKMCVKTKQLDMAILCLGHMKHVKGVRALRETVNNPDFNLDVNIGIVATQLGLYDDAEQLFRQAKRLDLLGYLMESRNKYNDAIDLTKNEHKICEKLTYFNYARALELEGNIEQAANFYSKTDCYKFEVPRMLLNRPRELINYLESSDDLEIKKWHAQYVESQGDINTALSLYDTAKDTLAITRLLCYLGREEEASDLIVKTNHMASAYHLAAHFESLNVLSQAIHFYTMAKAYNNAIRICKEHNMTEELLPLAMLASKPTQIDVAKYFEENSQPEKAVLLYHKAGLLQKALDIAFETQQYNALQLITADINSDSDPVVIEKCADFFMKNNQISNAIELLATGKKYKKVLDLIEEHNVTLTEDLAERITHYKSDNDVDNEKTRIFILEKTAEIAFEQGNYHLASKVFLQAGNKLKAMKALLKSGDTGKICFFAQVSRQPEIYIMAGNYLQSLDWQSQPEILKNIINFYSKGRAMDLLANFYVACAQVEIDEFQNYEKALDALNQAIRCLAKVDVPKDPEIHKRAVEVVNTRMNIIKQYLDIKKLLDRKETETAMFQVRQLLDTYGDSLEQSIRRGDLYSNITQHYISINNKEKAYESIEELKRLVPGINLTYYYNVDLLKSLGFQPDVNRENVGESEDFVDE